MEERPISDHASKGGEARAKALTAEQRSEISRKAVEARWARLGKLPVARATHEGILKIGDIEVECAVLEGGVRIFSQREMTKALGGKRGGSHWVRQRLSMDPSGAKLPIFLSANNLKPFIDNDLVMALNSQIKYLPIRGGTLAHGIRAELLPAICKVFRKAMEAKALHASQEQIAIRAGVLYDGLAEVGVIALVDEATGFQDDRERRALAKILETFIAKELRRWVQTFPVDYYKELYRLRRLAYPPVGNKMPRYFGMLTNDIVYSRLAPGVLDELKRVTPKSETGRRKHHFHRKLTEDVGHPKLLQHLGSVVALMKVSDDGDYAGFMKLLNKHFPPQTELPLFDQKPSGASASG